MREQKSQPKVPVPIWQKCSTIGHFAASVKHLLEVR